MKTRDLEPMISSGVTAVRTVLSRPKNQAKGDFGDNLEELRIKAMYEMNELHAEIAVPSVIDYERTMYEAADACAFLFAIIHSCARKIDEGNRIEYPNKEPTGDGSK